MNTEDEFCQVPPSLMCTYGIVDHQARTQGGTTLGGLSPTDMSEILAHARTQNVHTRPLQIPKKIPKAPLFSTVHMNLFLRTCLSLSPQLLSVSHIAELFEFCTNNDPQYVYKYQSLSLRALLTELEAHMKGKSSPNAPLGPDEPVMVQHLRRNLAQSDLSAATTTIPQFVVSQTHFRFAVDAPGSTFAPQPSGEAEARLGSEERDKYFSAQVRIKNEGKSSFFVRILQRESNIEGLDGPPDAVDFQVLLDRSVVKKQESATILLSLIAKPSAVFSSIQQMVVLSVEDNVRVVITFVVVNPYGPLFSRAFPCCLSSPVGNCPLGAVDAPIVLQLFKHVFQQKNGFTSKNIMPVLESALHDDVNRMAVLEAVRIRSILDEECDVFTLMCPISSHSHTAQAAAAAASSSPHTAEGASSVSPEMAPTEPGPVLVGGKVASPIVSSGSATPSSIASSKSQNLAFVVPPCLAEASPGCIVALILLWVSVFPSVSVDQSVIGCEPFLFLEQLPPCVQGVLFWIIDFCCLLLKHSKDNGLSERLLATVFCEALVHRKAPSLPAGEGSGKKTMEEINVAQHLGTTMATWIHAYSALY